jgi:hypothetical protein
MNGNRITGLPIPLANDEPVRLADLNSAIEGLAHKDSVRVATVANLNLAAPGAVIFTSSMVLGDRVLVKDQTAAAENGIYIWNGAAVAMTRSLDANTAAELEAAVVSVEEGASSGQSFRQTSVNFTLGTDSVAWLPFGTAAGPATETSQGIAEIATQAETDAGVDTSRFVTPQKLASSIYAVRYFAQNIGDGTSTLYSVTHNLGTRDVRVEVYRNSGNFDTVDCEVRRSSTNVIELVVVPAPAAGSLRALISRG